MSFESFFSLMFEDTIRDTFLSVKKSQSEQEEGIRKLLSDKERIIESEITSIDVKIKNNNDRIEYAKNKHLNLDYTYKTMKQDYLREIENAKTENKALFNQRDEYLNSLKGLRFRLSSLIETTAINNNRFKAANVLNGTSVVIAKDDYLNIIFVYSLLLLSICLDIFLAMVFCIIQNAYHKFYVEKSVFLCGGIDCNKSNLKPKLQKSIQTVKLRDKKVSNKVSNESLEFIASNLEGDNRTIKSLRQMNEDTKLSHYRIRKYLSDLKDNGLIIRKKQRLLLNIDADSLFSEENKKNNVDDQCKVIELVQRNE
ncbi:hypothetical protein [Borrelia persica]|uniref:hypothetical protein n=1 Tax=Borrelia persica TaxID=44448 RepID=UPI0004B8709D|nr:hypothetical protein [Borrelia persica]